MATPSASEESVLNTSNTATLESTSCKPSASAPAVENLDCERPVGSCDPEAEVLRATGSKIVRDGIGTGLFEQECPALGKPSSPVASPKPARAPICAPQLKPPPLPPPAHLPATFLPAHPDAYVPYQPKFVPHRQVSASELMLQQRILEASQMGDYVLPYHLRVQAKHQAAFGGPVHAQHGMDAYSAAGQYPLHVNLVRSPSCSAQPTLSPRQLSADLPVVQKGYISGSEEYRNLAAISQTDPGVYIPLSGARAPTDPGTVGFSQAANALTDSGYFLHQQTLKVADPGMFAQRPSPQLNRQGAVYLQSLRQGPRTSTDPGMISDSMIAIGNSQRSGQVDPAALRANALGYNVHPVSYGQASGATGYRSQPLFGSSGYQLQPSNLMGLEPTSEAPINKDRSGPVMRPDTVRRTAPVSQYPNTGVTVAAVPASMMEKARGRQQATALAMAAAYRMQEYQGSPGTTGTARASVQHDEQLASALWSMQQQQQSVPWQENMVAAQANVAETLDAYIPTSLPQQVQAGGFTVNEGDVASQVAGGLPANMAALVHRLQQAQLQNFEEQNMEAVMGGIRQMLVDQTTVGQVGGAEQPGLPWWHAASNVPELRLKPGMDEDVSGGDGSNINSFTSGVGSQSALDAAWTMSASGNSTMLPTFSSLMEGSGNSGWAGSHSLEDSQPPLWVASDGRQVEGGQILYATQPNHAVGLDHDAAQAMQEAAVRRWVRGNSQQ